MSGWVLAIDFGTTNTVASVADDAGVRTLTVDGRPVMPSAVFLERVDRPGSPDSWTVGERAVHLARRRLEQFEANPKRCVADGSIFLGGRSVPVQDAIAALLAPIVEEAAHQFAKVAPASVIVTHPASWAEDRIDVLRQAIRAVTRGRQWPEPTTLPEPVAAAQRILAVGDLPEQARLVVLDFGGGTIDVSVVDRHGPTVTVAGMPSGIDSLGGEDFDLRLAEWMCAEAGLAGMFEWLRRSPDPDHREQAVELRNHARMVKEALSKRTVVPGQVRRSPPHLMEDRPVQVSRDQLELLIGGGPGRPPGLAEAVGLVEHALRQAPTGPPFAGVFLVGGSSRITRLGVLVTEKTGRPPISQLDPTTAVSDGAAQFGLRQLQTPPARATATVAPPAVDGPAPAATSRHAKPQGRKRTALVLVVVAVLLGGVGAAYASNQKSYTPEADITCPDGSHESYYDLCPTTSPTTTPATSSAGVQSCGSASTSTCHSIMLANSRKVWPAMESAGSECNVYDRFFKSGADRYTVECLTSAYSYIVVWRSSSASYPAVVPVYADGMGRTPTEFSLDSDNTVLGSEVRGPVTADGQNSYLCAWEYEDYPVAMILEGADNNTTAAKCGDVQFLHADGMADLFG